MLDSTSARWLGAILNSEITNKRPKVQNKVFKIDLKRTLSLTMRAVIGGCAFVSWLSKPKSSHKNFKYSTVLANALGAFLSNSHILN